MKFPLLFTPVRINNLVVQNRVIMAPGLCGGELMSRSGAGVVLIRGDHRPPEDTGDVFVKNHIDLRHRIDEAHAGGAAASCHIHHFGLHSFKAQGPSDGYDERFGRPIKAMAEKDMEECIADYVAFALKAKAFDFDMIDMHLGHGWLGTQFLSPHYNKRTDKYGGSFENRARFPLRLIRAVREAVGPGYPLGMRWSAVDWYPDGLRLDETIEFLKLAAPYINAVEVSSGTDFEMETHVYSQTLFLRDRMPNLPFAKAVKEAVPGLVVAVVGAINDPADAEDMIAKGWVDMVSMSRSFLADPQWAVKARDGRDADICPCIRCKDCYSDRNYGCAVNPAYDFSQVKGPHDFPTPIRVGKAAQGGTPKNVVVVGAGPAGMQAAITARECGHDVTVLDKNGVVGGTLRHVRLSDYKAFEVGRLVDYLARQLDLAGADVRLNTVATPELVAGLRPDAVVVAVGAKLLKPRIDGIDGAGANVMDCFAALENKDRWGDRLAIVGGGVNGVEFALEQGVKRGKHAVIIEPTDTLAAKGNKDFKVYSRMLMDKAPNIERLTETSCVGITPEGVTVRAKDGAERFIPVDAVIYCIGLQSPAYSEILPYFATAPQVYYIGDARKPRIIKDAISEGFHIALSI